MSFRLLSPDGDGNGDPGEQNQDPPKPKTFTEEQLTKIVQERVKNLNRDKETLTTQVNQLQTQLSDLQKQLSDLQKPKDPPSDDVQGQINVLTERHRRETEGLQNRITDLEKKLSSAEQRALITERDKELDAALNKAGCTDMKIGRRTFVPQLSYDEPDQKWIFNLEKGGTVDIETGIQEELPDSLRRPRGASGGSGSSSGDRAKSRKATDLDAAEKKLQELSNVAKATGKSADIMAYDKQKNKVRDLQRELAVR
jgi:hypothetical protein